MLHGCSGISSHSAGIADRLGSWGYVALAVDSLGPRGVADRCTRSGYQEQAFDAYAALRYLAQQFFVDADADRRSRPFDGRHRGALRRRSRYGGAIFYRALSAAIAYYPACILPNVSLTAPTLILTGESDDWTPAERCREMVAHARPDSAPIALHVYPDAHHAFDVAALQPGRRAFGHSVEYNEAAAKDAAEKTRAFLAAHLAGTPAVGNKR